MKSSQRFLDNMTNGDGRMYLKIQERLPFLLNELSEGITTIEDSWGYNYPCILVDDEVMNELRDWAAFTKYMNRQ